MNRVSCIVPVFGLEIEKNALRLECLLRTIKRALLSLPSNCYEIIIVIDDNLGSANIVTKIIDQLNINKIVTIINNCANMGQAYSRNVGATVAKYEYLHFIDQDDFVSESFYSNFLLDMNMDIFISCPVLYYEDKNRFKRGVTPIGDLFLRRAKYLSDLWPFYLSNLAYSPGQVIISKEKIVEAGGFPNLRNRGSDDYGLFYNLAFKYEATVFYSYSSKFYYRIHAMQNSKKVDISKSVIEFLGETSQDSGLREKVIYEMRAQGKWDYLEKILYLMFFRR